MLCIESQGVSSSWLYFGNNTHPKQDKLFQMNYLVFKGAPTHITMTQKQFWYLIWPVYTEATMLAE